MLLKKPTVLLCSYTCLNSFPVNPQISSTSSTPNRRQPRPQPSRARAYADIAADHGASAKGHEAFPWPKKLDGARDPTPYEILDLKKGAPYRKRRFFELVKIYHPDRPMPLHVAPEVCPEAIRLERYRLVVAAHDILSDPVKRSAYDRFGAGWGAMRSITVPDYDRPQWKPGQDPSANATWEDWERWYHRDEKSGQHPLFVSNGAFVAFIVMFAALGGIAQVTRAGNFGHTLVERREMVHSQTSKDLKRVKQGASMGDRGAQVQSFLRHRDAETRTEESYRRLLPNPEVCSSDMVQGRDVGGTRP
ncbi:Hsp40 co-chaperone-like protein Jid1 [Phyllosticta citriasiana]|uniref:Hsp40 co-chaperone-like protein Jid1 n=1 Tax=Phyllosticta citriasiana TaxID=595635 RepID=A0ABR1KB18_9PEZI